ncbi:MAG: DNA mismatch repair protein MutS [Clostridiales bacterium]|nr:DNA mismatch repair protein MutS [Clostridiales bacterium]
MAEPTPMMQQYLTMKARYPDCLLFFRLGDFYEMFLEDAKLVSRELNLTLTTRDRNKPEAERTPMCGVPYHSAEAYISRLIAKGYKVAICEQVEDPAQAKGLVDRDIIRIVTPGTVIDASMLEEGRNNYICAICWETDQAGVSFCDLSTGEFSATAFSGETRLEHLFNLLGAYAPREAILSAGAYGEDTLRLFLTDRLNCRCENAGDALFQPDAAQATLAAHLSPPPEPPQDGDGQAHQIAARAGGGLLAYLYDTQKTDLSHITTLVYDLRKDRMHMELDLTARRNLELTETLRGKEKRGSLLWVLDRTKTPMGHRLIRAWVERPLLHPAPIGRRLAAVEALVKQTIVREELLLCLREVSDLERLIGRIVYGSAGGRDLVSLGAGLGRLPALRSLLEAVSAPLLDTLRGALDDLPALRDLIARALVDDPPFSVREGGFIRGGYSADVDRLRDVLENSNAMLAAVETRERERTGIKSLKVGFNKVFGYYLEVSKSYYDLVPDDFIRKQTLVSSERFITQELKDLEHTILSAQDKIVALEFQLFTALREEAAAQVAAIQRSAAAVAELDVLTSFAAVAASHNYCMPQVDLSDRIEITEGRHPVVEQMLKTSLFVPNDTRMDAGENMVSIITGPNMAGKSTYMRQVALITLMAQMGSFVPAKAARIGIVDRVFTRIGASDDLSAGQSTFMVEMSEVAELLKHATPRSLLILDEIGRGTSTYDGMAIARAVLEHCADPRRLGCKTLFATHYHELTCLEGALPGIKNYNIAAKKRKDDIIFLRKIIRGSADQSYGVEVAALAGVPDQVVRRARSLLRDLEAGGCARETAPAGAPEDTQVSLAELGHAEVLARLRGLPVETLTPIEALNLLYELKQKL